MLDHDTFKLPIGALMMSKTAIGENALPNSIMNRQQANRFIDLVVDTSVLIKNIRVSRVDHPKGEINKLDLGEIATEGASATSSATTTVPSESSVEYDMEKYRSAFDLESNFLEDNLEGAAIRNKLLSMFSKRISQDSELALIESDDSLPTGDAQSRENNLLGVNDGLRKILLANVPSAQIIDALGTAPSKAMFYDAKRLIPARYRVARPAYTWIVGSDVFDKWALDWSDRETGGGDSALAGTRVPGPWGISMLEIPTFPDDLSYSGSASNRTDIWLTPLDNLIYFIQRDITVEFERRPRLDKWEVTIHFRIDFQVENPDLVVYVKNINVDGNDYT